jgi:hypothetical protein
MTAEQKHAMAATGAALKATGAYLGGDDASGRSGAPVSRFATRPHLIKF